MKNKICFITTGLGMGGAERQICDLSDELYKLNNEVIIISLTGDSIVRPNSPNITIFEINIEKSFLGLIKALLKCRTILKKFKPNIIHSHMVHANIFTRILRLFCQMPLLVCTAHSTNEGGKARIFAYKITDFLADLTTNVSVTAVNVFVEKGAAKADKIISVSNGLDVNKFKFSFKAREEKRILLQLDNKDILYLAIGRLQPEKDYHNMLNAFSLVVNKAIKDGIKIQLAIIGSGCLESELKLLRTKLGLDDYIIFLGMQKDVERWLSAADYFVLSSEYEGFGLVVGEALLTELPVIATDCGGVKEVIGEYGYLVPPKDSHALSQAMIKALTISAEERANLVKKGRYRIIEKFSITSIAQRWLEIYQS